MDSDSDETIIEESEDEAMEYEVFLPSDAQNQAVTFPHVQNIENSANSNVPEVVNVHNIIINQNADAEAQQEVHQEEPADDNSTEAPEPPPDSEDDSTQSPSLVNIISVHVLRDADDSPKPSQEDTDKKEKGQSPKKRAHIDEDNEDDGKTCPICLDNWTNLGEHRICALKCGHLFGLGCILRWFSLQKKKSCPTCKKKAARADIRYIYAKKLIAMDVTELEDIKKQLDNVTQEKNKVQIELTKAVCREHLIMQQVEDLKKKVQYLDTALEVRKKYSNSQTSSECTKETVRLYMDKSLEICREGGCRVLDCSSRQDLIVASMKSPNTLFPGFGVRKINLSTYRPTAFIPLHAKTIRDIRFHPENPWILSVSLDKTVKIVDTTSCMPVCLKTGDSPLWSCCWDANDLNMLYVGQQQGSVLKFDVRHMAEPVCMLEVPGDISPVVSVASIATNHGGAVPHGGIISCKLNSVWVFENTPNEYTRYPLPLEGPFICMTYENDNQQLLVSTRSNSRIPYSRHHLCTIESGTSNNLLCNLIHCFTGSTMQKYLSRSCLVKNNSDLYVAAHQESSNSVYLWNVRTGYRAGSLPARDPVMDVCGVNINNNHFVTSLTERKLEFFKFV